MLRSLLESEASLTDQIKIYYILDGWSLLIPIDLCLILGPCLSIIDPLLSKGEKNLVSLTCTLFFFFLAFTRCPGASTTFRCQCEHMELTCGK